MALNKKQRRLVWAKSGGLCWYCGCDLPEKGWHVDHFLPIRRYDDIEINEDQVRHFKNCVSPELDTFDNWVPACRPCNLFKSVYEIEDFRRQLMQQTDRARKYSVNFRNAERFGMITINPEPILFWFEQLALNPTPHRR